MSVVYFLLLVSLLVVIHEFGHFVAAKALDLRVLRFSVGYGRPLLRLTLRETEYQVCLFPLGGYVQILGIEDPEASRPSDATRSFANRPLWQRLAVVFAGPTANFCLATAIYFSFFASHTELPAAVVGDVLPMGTAAQAGISPGDTVVSIDGEAVEYWEDIERLVRQRSGKEVQLRLLRNGKPIDKFLFVNEDVIRTRDGQSRQQGRIGITHSPFVPIVGVLDEKSPASQAGIATGDLIISVDGAPVANWTEVDQRIGRMAHRSSIVYLRGSEVPGIPQIRLLDARFADLVPESRIDEALKRSSYTGLERAEMFVAKVDAGSPADLAGIRPADLIVALDGEPVRHWIQLDQRLLSDPDRSWVVTWQRAEGGQVVTESAPITQVWQKGPDEFGHPVTRLVFGARNDVDRGRGRSVAIEGRLGYALSRAIERTRETISIMVAGFSSIIAGDSPSEALGGPLMMYRVASVSGHRGWEGFWLMLALISVNLGLINLLPVPMLDGGHVVIFAVEAARRRPLSARGRERVQKIGLLIIAAITILAARADIMRYLLS